MPTTPVIRNPTPARKRIIPIMELLKSYGVHARRAIPQLEANAEYFETGEPKFPKRLSLGKAKLTRETIAQIKSAERKPELLSLKSLVSGTD